VNLLVFTRINDFWICLMITVTELTITLWDGKYQFNGFLPINLA